MKELLSYYKIQYSKLNGNKWIDLCEWDDKQPQKFSSLEEANKVVASFTAPQDVRIIKVLETSVRSFKIGDSKLLTRQQLTDLLQDFPLLRLDNGESKKYLQVTHIQESHIRAANETSGAVYHFEINKASITNANKLRLFDGMLPYEFDILSKKKLPAMGPKELLDLDLLG